MNSAFFKFLASPLTRACLCLTACLLLLTPAHAKRTALVIGNDNYTTVSKLQKAGNDATAMARELRAAGFAVQLHKDLNYRSMVKAVETFANGITGGDEVVVFYAGHGVQIKTGSYLLPTDIEAMSESEVEKTAYELNALSDKISESKPAFTLVLVDACRDNPLKSRGRNVGNARGLSAIEPPKGQIVVYSASRGQQALDRLGAKDANPNGVFTREFIARMKKPGVKIEDLMREVQDSVEALAKTVNHDQRPAIYNEARGNFYFFGPTTVQVAPSAPVAPEMTASQREDAFWSDAKAAGNREAFQAYLDSYPRGRYISLARANTARLNVVNVPPRPVTAAQPLAVPQSLLNHDQALKDCDVCPELVVVPAGVFIMGSNDSADEQPPHSVTVKTFALGRTEVTQGQWKAIMGSNPSHFNQCGNDCPVENVSWEDVQEYIQKLNAKTDKSYRLPSEAEWEYAARAGNTGKWGFDNDESRLSDYAWYGENSGDRAHPVAGKQPNAWGLNDMYGNVSEWTQDCWNRTYRGAPEDGSAWTAKGICSQHALRGGSWDNPSTYLRAAIRVRYEATFHSFSFGFRLARSL
jgi:formylglycine-generating enzyme required for sulfatase activity